MAKIYRYNDYEYHDEEEQFDVEAVRKELVQYFPELSNAKAEESEDDEGNTVVTFVKRAGTKGLEKHGCADVPPMPDVDLFKLETEVRCARNDGRTVELDAEQVLSLIGEAWYLRRILSEPEESVGSNARS